MAVECKNKFYFVTGKVGVGKTSFINGLVEKKEGFAGIITAEKNGLRILTSILTGEDRLFEVDNSFNSPVQKIGRFAFDDTAFLWAEREIANTDLSNVKCFILDEVGYLEINKNGFYNAIQILIEKIKDYETEVIFVTREDCADDFMRMLGL